MNRFYFNSFRSLYATLGLLVMGAVLFAGPANAQDDKKGTSLADIGVGETAMRSVPLKGEPEVPDYPLYQSALDHVQAGEDDQAIEKFTAILQNGALLPSGRVKIHISLAALHGRNNRDAEVIKEIKKALKIRDGRGRFLVPIKRWKFLVPVPERESLLREQEALRLATQDEQYDVILECSASLRQANEVEEQAKLYRRRADAYFKLLQSEEAMEDLQKAWKLSYPEGVVSRIAS